jgi:hypothetical protein
MSHAPRVVALRLSPRWSTPPIGPWSQVVALPPPMAGLPLPSAAVSVGPPLLASEPSPGAGTLTWSPLTPLVSPVQPVPLPIRLCPPGRR